MNIKSLYQDVKFKNGYYDLFRATILYRYEQDSEKKLSSYEVQESDEMRIDLVMKNIYDLSPDSAYYLENIDVLCVINNIDNPLNIKKGMILLYPSMGDIESFRITDEADLKSKKKSILNKIGVPNKQTRTDSSRKKYQENNFSLPPTANSKPKSPVTIENGNFKIGGV
jgi:hypothetical protein